MQRRLPALLLHKQFALCKRKGMHAQLQLLFAHDPSCKYGQYKKVEAQACAK